jgi:hypothetical protein
MGLDFDVNLADFAGFEFGTVASEFDRPRIRFNSGFNPVAVRVSIGDRPFDFVLPVSA